MYFKKFFSFFFYGKPIGVKILVMRLDPIPLDCQDQINWYILRIVMDLRVFFFTKKKKKKKQKIWKKIDKKQNNLPGKGGLEPVPCTKQSQLVSFRMTAPNLSAALSVDRMRKMGVRSGSDFFFIFLLTISNRFYNLHYPKLSHEVRSSDPPRKRSKHSHNVTSYFSKPDQQTNKHPI